MRTKNCYSELPEGYKLVKEVDAVKDKKFVVLLNVVAGVIMILAAILLWVLRFKLFGGSGEVSVFLPLDVEPVWQLELFLLILVICTVVYLVLHELTHGIVYKLLTHEKLKFGLTLSCAYCGVPHVFVTRKTALLSLITPLSLFSLVFLLMVFLTDGWLATMAILLFSIHFGGCSGDMYDTWLLLTSLRGDILMNDTGPKQSFYLRQ